MVTTKYVLDHEFESFEAGTKFVRTATYGKGQIDDAKLEEDSTYSTKSVKVTEEDLEEFFSVIN